MVVFKKWVIKRSNHYAYLAGRDFWWYFFSPLPVLLMFLQYHAGFEFGMNSFPLRRIRAEFFSVRLMGFPDCFYSEIQQMLRTQLPPLRVDL